MQVQVGWVREASIMPLAWAAQWLHYAQQLKLRLQAPALVVPVFEQRVSASSLCMPFLHPCDGSMRLQSLSCGGKSMVSC